MGNVFGNITKRDGTIGALQGTLYEIQVIFLFMIRACSNNVKFTLANNVNGFGNFDDLVASCELPDGTWKYVCLQCKHLKDSEKTKINLGRLTDNKEKNFNLNKYREEILKAGSKISDYKDIDVDLLFYTTVSIDDTDKSLSWCNVDKNDILCKLLDTSDADNRVRVFSQPGNKLLVEKVANDQEFVKKITIFSQQCREENIESVIRNSLIQLLGNHADDTINNIYQNIKSELEKWFKKEKAVSLCNETFISWTWTNVLKEVPFLSVEETLKEFSSTYSICDDRIEELRNQISEYRTLVIKSENTFLAALEVYQAVQDDKSHMFVNLQDLDQVLPLFEHCKDLMIVSHDEAAGVGIISSLDHEKAKFLHFTFAEFLVASFISCKLGKCEFDAKLQALLDEVLHKNRWRMVRKFLNNSPYINKVTQDNVEIDKNQESSVSGHSALVNIEIIDKYNPLVKCAINNNNLLHIAVREKNCNIAKFTIKCLQECEREKYISFQKEGESRFGGEISALCLAVEFGHKAEAELLLNYNADKVNKEDSKGELLLNAAERGHVDVVTLLLDLGADVNHEDEDGQTALIRVAEGNFVDVVSLLLDRGADINHKDSINMTAILKAAWMSTVETVKLLHARGASLDDKDKAGRTLLMCSARNRRHDVITYVESQGRYDIHNRDNTGMTALHQAVGDGLNLNVKTLLDLGADINSQDNAGNTPLHEAVKSWTRTLQCVQYLCQRGADRSVKNKRGQTVLDVECFHDETKQWLQQNLNNSDIEVRGELTNGD